MNNEKLRAAINRLTTKKNGEERTSKEVAAYLRKKKIKGSKSNPWCCPIGNPLNPYVTVGYRVAVIGPHIHIETTDGVNCGTISTSSGVKHFTVEFDNGDYEFLRDI